jgi:hypothetical protein
LFFEIEAHPLASNPYNFERTHLGKLFFMLLDEKEFSLTPIIRKVYSKGT